MEMIDEQQYSVKQVQNWMQAMMIRHVPVADAGVPAGVTVEDLICASERLSPARHFSIYRQSYIARLRACMESQFKVLAYALDKELFREFADQYLDSYPSGSYTLNNLGERFSSFLAETRPDADAEEKELWPDFMIELAAFEYAVSVIFDMHSDSKMVAVDETMPDELLTAAPTLHLFAHQFPICRYYLDFSNGGLPEIPFPEPSYCAAARQNFRLGLFPLGMDQYTFLTYIKQGASVGEAKDKLATAFNFKRDKLEEAWAIWRRNFTASGFFTCR